MPIAIEYRSDHVQLRMVGPAALSSLRRVIVVPYSSIALVDVEPPRWPPILANRIGTHMPGVIVSGTFMSWRFGHKRFLHFDRNTRRVLTLRLAGHPTFEEVSVEVRDAEAAKKELDARRAAT